MRALLIGESWGINELQFRHPFVGRSGQELARMCHESGLIPPLLVQCKHCHRHVPFGHCKCGHFNAVNFLQMVAHWSRVRASGVAVANVFNAHPDKDNEQLFFGSKLDPVCLDIPPMQVGSKKLYLLEQNRHHYEALEQTIQDLKPNILIPLGNTASWAITGQTGIGKIRGTIIPTRFGIKALCTYHPAALRDWKLRGTIISDLRKAHQESQTPTISRPPCYLHINVTLQDIGDWFQDGPYERLSCDIESGLALFSKSEVECLRKKAPRAFGILTQLISMVGFSRSESEGLVIQFVKRRSDGGIESHWNSQLDEIRAWEWVQYGLSTGAELVAQNGMYDYNRLLCAGMRPWNMKHDTMLLHHALLPELPKSLGYLDSIFRNDSPWKLAYGAESLKRDD